MNDRVTRAMLRVLRALGPFVPAEDRPWLEALAAEADAVAPGRPRFDWVLGAVAVVLRSPTAGRRFGWVLSAATAVTFVGLSWYSGVDAPPATANRVQAVVTMTVLVLLPVVARTVARVAPQSAAGLTPPRRRAGTTGAGPAPTARLVRLAGTAGVWALVPLAAAVSRATGRLDPCLGCAGDDGGEWASARMEQVVANSTLLLPLLVMLASCVLWATSQQESGPASLVAVGSGVGVVGGVALWTLAPYGALAFSHGWPASLSVVGVVLIPVGATLLAGRLAARRGGRSSAVVAASVAAGTFGALVFVGLGLVAMLAARDQVPLVWANPDPLAVHGTAQELQMSLGDAAIRYEALLLIGPLTGLAFGAVAAASAPVRRRVVLAPR